MEAINALTRALQGGPLGGIIGAGVAIGLVASALLIARWFGIFDDDKSGPGAG
jgi:hypothetical protein